MDTNESTTCVMAVPTQDEILEYVNLQLAGAAGSSNVNAMLSVRQVYTNIKRFTSCQDLEYSYFIAALENMRDQFNIRDGEIGVDVSYISLKRS